MKNSLFLLCLFTNQEPSSYGRISLVKLSRPVEVGNPFIQTIALAPQDGYNYTGENCYYSGWGNEGDYCFITFEGHPLKGSLLQQKLHLPWCKRCLSPWSRPYLKPAVPKSIFLFISFSNLQVTSNIYGDH